MLDVTKHLISQSCPYRFDIRFVLTVLSDFQVVAGLKNSSLPNSVVELKHFVCRYTDKVNVVGLQVFSLCEKHPQERVDGDESRENEIN